MNLAQKCLSKEHIGSTLSAKIIIYTFTRARLLCRVRYETPCTSSQIQEKKNMTFLTLYEKEKYNLNTCESACLPVLRIFQEQFMIVQAASSTIIVSFSLNPRTKKLRFIPSFVERKQGCVDQATNRHFRKLGKKIIKRHPKAQRKIRSQKGAIFTEAVRILSFYAVKRQNPIEVVLI